MIRTFRRSKNEARARGSGCADGAIWTQATPVLVILAGLYVSQGISHGFFNRTFPVLLRQSGVSVEAIGLAHLVFLPWVLNVLWSPLVDRWRIPGIGRRKSWIVPSQWLLGMSLIGVGLWLSDGLAASALAGVAILAVVASAIAATQDLATDGYATETLGREGRGWGNGVQIGGYWVGLLIGSAGVLALQQAIGIVGALALMAVLMAGVSIAVALRREEAVPPDDETTARPSLWRALQRPDIRTMLLLIVAYRLGDGFGKAMMLPYFVDIGLSSTDIAWLLGTGGVAAALAGSLCGAILLRPLGARFAVLLFGAAQVVSLALFMLLSLSRTSSLPAILAVVCIEYFVVSLVFVALYALMMERCSRKQTATDFAIQACMGNLVAILASSLSGFSVGALGYSGHFAFALALAIVGLGFVAMLIRRLPDGVPPIEIGRAPVEGAAAISLVEQSR